MPVREGRSVGHACAFCSVLVKGGPHQGRSRWEVHPTSEGTGRRYSTLGRKTMQPAYVQI